MEEFASDLEGYSSQYIKHLINKAEIFAVKSHATAINRNQILKAIRRFKEHNTNATQSLQDIYAPSETMNGDNDFKKSYRTIQSTFNV